jgi:hypothetical protein
MKIAVAALLAAAAVSVNAQTRMEPAGSPFTYEALGATPSIALGRKSAPKSVDTDKPVAAQNAGAPRAPGTTSSAGPFTYDAVGATPHVEAKKPTTEAVTPAPAR